MTVHGVRGRFQQCGNAVNYVMNTMVMEWWCSCVVFIIGACMYNLVSWMKSLSFFWRDTTVKYCSGARRGVVRPPVRGTVVQ